MANKLIIVIKMLTKKFKMWVWSEIEWTIEFDDKDIMGPWKVNWMICWCLFKVQIKGHQSGL